MERNLKEVLAVLEEAAEVDEKRETTTLCNPEATLPPLMSVAGEDRTFQLQKLSISVRF